ncbi:lipopolysaccharide biosynthesis protein [Pedobacter sp. PACM 27299]|uniref:lipopolysaccharide biosynthesis protein n=1 Tax=Pedobacter sp. PACM 27299 TaxID=1727164 RepID=UPI00070653E8|nr:lipopolysaccharide biosynthesis protein [Pedobacter sp. PACM 27299]ALL04383.1 lipopolysaccharide biosynthesis protein [Pedobacter sp. PACM 27299]
MDSKNINQDLPPSDEMSLKELVLKIIEWWRFLLSKWIIILILGIIGGTLGFYYAKSKKKSYTAVTTFVLQEEGSGNGMGSLASIASIAGVDIGGGGGGIFQGDNIIELYKSRTMIEKTLLTKVNFNGKDQLLLDHYIDFNKLRDIWADNPDLKKLKFSTDGTTLPVKDLRLRDSVLGTIVADINTNYLIVGKLDKKLSLIKAEVKATDEYFAKVFNEQIVKNVNDFYTQTKTKKTQDNITILQHKTDSVRSVMNGAIYAAAVVADATPNLNPVRQVQRAAPIQRSQFSAETNKAMLSTLVQNLEMSKMSLLKETPLIQVIDIPVYPLAMERPSKLKGIIIGGFISVVLCCLYLVVKRFFKIILS